MNKSKPVKLWAVEVIQQRSRWIHHFTIRETRGESIRSYNQGWRADNMFQKRRRQGLVRCIKVEVRPL